MATRDEVQTLEQDLAGVELDDQEIEGTAPADTTIPADPGDGDARAEVEVAGTEPTEVVEAVPEPAWQPPDGGQPFAFRADGKEIPVEGALRYDHGTYIPAKSWEQVQKYLGDWEAHRTRQQALQRQYEDRDPDKHVDVLRARATLQNLQALLSQGPEKVAEWLDDFQRNAQVFQYQAENAALQRQLELRTGQHTELTQAQARQHLEAEMPGHFRQTLDAAISQMPELKHLVGLTAQVYDDLSPLMKKMYVENRETGEWNVDPDILLPLLKKEAKRVADTKELQKAAALNAKATSKAKPDPTIAARGATPGGRADKQPTRDNWQDQFLADSLED